MQWIPFKSSQVHYVHAGHGSNIVVCLHGYGESANSYQPLIPHLPGYRLIAIDLPFHGKTQWEEGLRFTPSELLQIIDNILARHDAAGASFSLMGFSMGGRAALSLLQAAPQRVQKLVLLAADGLMVNFFYWLATQNAAGNQLFRYTMKHPQWLFFTLRSGRTLGIVNKRIYKFATHYIDNQNLRNLLYQRWTCMRRFKPNLAAIKRFIAQYHIPVQIVFGEYDPVFRPRTGQKFRKGIESFCTLHTVQTGHQILQPRHAALIAGFL